MQRGAVLMVGSAVLIAAAVSSLSARQTPATQPYVPKQSDRPSPMTEDEPGFTPIFDGKSLTGWDGNPTYWRAENGVAGRRDYAFERHQEQHLRDLARRAAA